MKRSDTQASALRLSALMVVAGTVLGVAGQVLAQSAPVEVQVERAHRDAAEARAQAQKIVTEMRKELSRSHDEADDDEDGDDEQEARVIVKRGGGEGVWTTELPRKRVQVEVQPEGQKRQRVQVRTLGEGEERGAQRRYEVQVEPGEGKRKIERIEVRRLGDEGGAKACPECGCQCCGGGDDRVIELRGLGGLEGMHLPGLEGLKGMRMGELKELRGMKLEGMPGGDHVIRLRGMGGDDEGGPEPKVFGKAIVIGPDGKKQEFNFGGDDAAPRAKAPKPPKAPKAPKAMKPAQGGMFFRSPQGAVPPPPPPPPPAPDAFDGHGAGHGQGTVIIITPDGQRREFHFGGEGGPHSEVIDLFDGNQHAAHPVESGANAVPLGTGDVRGAVKVVRMNRGGAI